MLKQLFLVIIHFLKMNIEYLKYKCNNKRYKITYLDKGKIELIIL